MKSKPWTQEQVDEFISWHESALERCGYPQEILNELRESRTNWLAGCMKP